MITKTTNLGAEYQDLFAEIAEKSGGRIKVDNLEQFFGCIQEIKELDRKFLRLPLDEPMFEINADTRRINVETTPFRANGLSVQGDHLAETVFFKIDRYFDTMDLMNADIFINWKMGPIVGRDRCTIKSDSIVPGYIVFAWPISNAMTQKAGALQFSVSLEITQDEKIAYSLNTLTANLNVKDGLVLKDAEVFDMTSNMDAILFNSEFGDGEAAVEDITWASGLVKELGDEFTDVMNLTPVNEDGVLSSQPVILHALAAAGLDAAIMYSDENKAPMENDYVEYPDGLALKENVVYYVPVAGELGVYQKATNEQKAIWGTEDQVPLYVSTAKVVVDGVGEYYVNAQGVKYDTNGVKIGASAVSPSAIVRVPEAETPKAVNVIKPEFEQNEEYTIEPGTQTIFLEEGGTTELSATAELENGFGLLSFTWVKDDEEVLDQDKDFKAINASSLNINSEGEYKVKVQHYRNGDTIKTAESDPCLVSYYASKITADIDTFNANNILELDKPTTPRGYTRGANGTVNIVYTFEVDDPKSSEIRIELLDELDNVIPITYNPIPGENKVKCIIDSANIAAEGEFKFRVSNVYNGSIYSTNTRTFYINIREV